MDFLCDEEVASLPDELIFLTKGAESLAERLGVSVIRDVPVFVSLSCTEAMPSSCRDCLLRTGKPSLSGLFASCPILPAQVSGAGVQSPGFESH